MNTKHLPIAFAMAVSFAVSLAQAQPVCLSVDGIQSFGLLDDPDNVIIDLNIGAGNSLQGFALDANIATFGESFVSEARILISNSLGTADPNRIFLFPVGEDIDAPGNMSISTGGKIFFSDENLPNVTVRVDGILRLQFFESFDDNPNAVDAIWSDLSEADAAVCPGLHLQCANQAACDNAVLGFSSLPPEPLDISVVAGSWLDPATAGQGIFFDFLPTFNQVFMAWFTYTNVAVIPEDPPPSGVGGPGQRWLTALLTPDGNTLTGELIVTEGGAFDLPRPGSFRTRTIGTITIEFTACDAAVVSYQIDNPPISNQFTIIPLEQFVNPGGFSCDVQTPLPPGAFDFSVVESSLLDPATDGQGIFFDFLPSFNQVFMAWFTYTNVAVIPEDPPPPGVGGPGQRWLTALLTPDGNTLTGELIVTEGGAFDQPRPGSFRTRLIGTITIEFTACDAAVVSYQIDDPPISNQFPIMPLELHVNPANFSCFPPGTSTIAFDVGELVGAATSTLLQHAIEADSTPSQQRSKNRTAPMAVIRRLSLKCPIGGDAKLVFDSDGSRTVPAGARIMFTDCSFNGRHSGAPITVNGALTTRGSYTAEDPDTPVTGEMALSSGETLVLDGEVTGDGGYIGLIDDQPFTLECQGCIFTGPPDIQELNPFQGSMTGTWNGTCATPFGSLPVSGGFSTSIDEAGVVRGSFNGDGSGSITGTVDLSGTLSASGTAGLAAWNGTITRTGSMLSGSGQWSGVFDGSNCNGGWSGSGVATQ